MKTAGEKFNVVFKKAGMTPGADILNNAPKVISSSDNPKKLKFKNTLGNNFSFNKKINNGSNFNNIIKARI